MCFVITGVPDCLHWGNPITKVKSLKGTTFVEQVMDDIYDYNYDDKLIISLGDVEHDTTEELHKFVNNTN